MKKKIFSLMMIFTLIFGAVRAEASDIIPNSFTDLLLAAKHYYNTNLAGNEITLTHPKSNEYRFSGAKDGKGYYVTMVLKDWGVWNLGDMKFSDGGQEKTIIGGGTDWEYVFRVYVPTKQLLEFSGGNHGNEEFVDIAFYDGETMEEIYIDVGGIRTVKRIVVVEHTKLLDPGTLEPYANVQRTYTLFDTTVDLDTSIEFISTVNMAMSYTAMACVNKDFGRYCEFDNGQIVTAEPKGVTGGKYLGRMESMRCKLSGEDTSATLTVGIFNTGDMTDGFSNFEKTFLWDMTDEFTKLYFSKYDLSSLTEIAEGTAWNLSAYWQANI